jgi:hypothetical protein
LPRFAIKKTDTDEPRSNRSLVSLNKPKSFSPVKQKEAKRLPPKAAIKLPSITVVSSPPKPVKTLRPAISLPIYNIKRRFRNARKLLRLVPVNDFDLSILDNSPYIETVLDRNWAKKTEDLSKVIPVYENRWAEDESSSQDEGSPVQPSPVRCRHSYGA